ncbi:MAG: hypothetical protein WA160_04115 [Pseudobdellovibrio sp.]
MKNLNLVGLFTVGLITFSTFSTQALQTNPQIRICNQFEGEFLVAQNGDDQVGLCKLDSAIIGSLDLLSLSDAISSNYAQSIQIYEADIRSCEPYGQIITIQLLQSYPLDVCFFNDGSMIEINTLKSGIHSTKNIKLNKVLGF